MWAKVLLSEQIKFSKPRFSVAKLPSCLRYSTRIFPREVGENIGSFVIDFEVTNCSNNPAILRVKVERSSLKKWSKINGF